VERFVNRKLDKAEAALKKRERKVRSWYQVFINGEEDSYINEMHIFMASFVAGMAIGVLTG
jgi:FUN14 domain-containing protein 1